MYMRLPIMQLVEAEAVYISHTMYYCVLLWYNLLELNRYISYILFVYYE